jgi:hypothetical protein
MDFLEINIGRLEVIGTFPIRKGISRKLVSFPDMEGKQRVVAELDYFSQTCLKPLHHYLFRILKKIPQDKTFNQHGFLGVFDDYPDEIFSVDLKDATDRFPIEFIIKVLSGILPESYLLHWKTIMVGLPFSYKGEWISYHAGNPMGAYSS